MNDSLSKFSKFTKFTKYLLEIESDVWQSFRLIAYAQNMTIKEAIRQAIIEYIQNHQLPNQKIEIKIIENKKAKENILQVVIEEEIRTILKELINAKMRKAPYHYINQQKQHLIDLIKKQPYISKELAEEIKIVLQNLRT